MDRRQDPRTIVTPYAFSVHPDLLGRPLATPWQRLGAFAIDGVVIFALGRALGSLGGVTLAIASALLLFWLAFRKPGKDVVGRFFRFSVGCLGVLILSVTILVAVILKLANDPEIQDAVQEIVDSRGIEVDLSGVPGVESVGLGVLGAVLPDVMALGNTEDPDEAQTRMNAIARKARAGGSSLREIREALEGLMPDDAPWSGQSQEMVDAAMSSLSMSVPEGEVESTDSSTGEVRSDITETAALDSISTLNARLRESDQDRKRAETARDTAQARLLRAEEAGFLNWLKGILDDLGIGFGLGALYLTIIQAWWKGSSVGKKLFRIRVVMIDKRPLNLWLSFERVGGYAAGLATGMLGFAQIFWDPNRQAIHDKVSETIVIQDGKDPVPGPWMAE